MFVPHYIGFRGFCQVFQRRRISLRAKEALLCPRPQKTGADADHGERLHARAWIFLPPDDGAADGRGGHRRDGAFRIRRDAGADTRNRRTADRHEPHDRAPERRSKRRPARGAFSQSADCAGDDAAAVPACAGDGVAAQRLSDAPAILISVPAVFLLGCCAVYSGWFYGRGDMLTPAQCECSEQIVRFVGSLVLLLIFTRSPLSVRAALPGFAGILAGICV